MIKKIVLSLFTGLFSLLTYAQWSPKDSLDLSRLLKTDGEIQLNKNAIKNIDFGNFIGEQKAVDEKFWLDADITLPKVLPEEIKPTLTLHPYKLATKYNYDPIYQKKIKITKDTWKFGDVDAWKYGGSVHMKLTTVPSDWAEKPFDPGIRKSVDEIEATGLRYNPLAKINGMTVGAWVPAGGSGIKGDFMAVFTKEFWDKKGRDRRKRTLELLQNYGDSTTVQLKEEIKKAVVP